MPASDPPRTALCLTPPTPIAVFHIRRPTLHDLNECAQLDPSYTTQHVWQMQLRVEETDIETHFHLVHLPRPMTVTADAANDDLLRSWQAGECMLAAREGHAVLGFLHMRPEPAVRSGLILRHVVAPLHRRRGAGGALLQQALQWGSDHQLRSLRVRVSTKNHPAIQFYLAHGFAFGGFHERFYSDQEIILDLARSIR